MEYSIYGLLIGGEYLNYYYENQWGLEAIAITTLTGYQSEGKKKIHMDQLVSLGWQLCFFGLLPSSHLANRNKI